MEKLRNTGRAARASQAALPDGAPPIEDYAAVGNGLTVALVSSAGDVDWCCFPRFDGEFALGRLLDRERGGSLSLSSVGANRLRERAYEVGANVLIRTVRTEDAVAKITEGLIPHRAVLVRHAYGAQGRSDLRAVFRPDARVRGDVRQVSRTELRLPLAPGFPEELAVAAPAPWKRSTGGAWRSTVPVEPGGTATWAIGIAADVEAARSDGFGRCLRSAIQRDRAWSSRIRWDGEHADAVRRSALALRLLLHAEGGGVIAAPTTSLPEVLGGDRNWDYRYCWLRDATLILKALMQLGLHDAAMEYWTWLEQIGMAESGLRIVYAVDGGPCPPERELDEFAGYRGSRPVRVGNAAARQVQRDVNGYLLEAAAACQAILRGPHTRLAPTLRFLADDSAANWDEPGQGQWESRGPARHFVHSKLMSWVALDRALGLAQRGWLEGDVGAWRSAREACRRAILERGFDRRRGTFVQAFDRDDLDASALLIPLVGFLPARDPRVLSTLDVIGRELGEGELMRRFQHAAALEGREGSFLLCSFWWVEALALAGRDDQAREHFAALLGRRNDVGLFAEEIDPDTGAFLGNFPQGFSHLGLVRAAHVLRGAREGEEALWPGARPASDTER